MNRKAVSGIILTLLLTGMLTLAFKVQTVKASGTVGVKAGDWIKCTYTISGWPSGTPYPEWLKVEFLSVEGTNATIRVTMRMSDGTEQSDTMTVDVAAGGGTFQGLSGFVIPANCTTGDSIYMTGYGNVTIAGETTRIYAGASRTVVYASFSQYGTQLTYYWDKLTGVMVEASAIYPELGITATAKATETNMWQAETIYIRADGSIDPPDAPISTVDNVTYTLTGNVTSDADGIVVERDNIVVDGAGFTVQGNGTGIGIYLLPYIDNVTIRIMKIKTFSTGISLGDGASNNFIIENQIEGNSGGISLSYFANNNTIFRNNVTENKMGGITIVGNGNVIIENFVANTTGTLDPTDLWSGYGINIYVSDDNTIMGNKVFTNKHGIRLYHSYNNTISNNEVADNQNGISLHGDSGNNKIFHNNLINNTWQVSTYISSTSNVWDDGYPSGGNYWSDYTGVDEYSGVNQDQPGGDWIGDTPYVIDENNQDEYPLMEPYPPTRDVGVEVGDWGMYDFAYDWTGTPPPNHELLNNIERVMIEVKAISGSVITYGSTLYLKNDTNHILPDYTVDVSPTGSYPLAGVFWFIGANLSAGDGLYQRYSSLYINETVVRTYCGEPREVNHFNASVTYYVDYDMDCYWDKETGILTEEYLKQYHTLTDSYSIKLNMTDTNIWGFPVHNLNVGQGYATIQGAINASETLDGHTILVDEGIYYERVTVDKSLTLIGEDRSATVIDGNGTWIAVTLSGTNITFSTFTVKNTDVGVFLVGSNIYVSGIHVDNCHLGVWARETFECVISGNNLNNHTVKKGAYEDFGGVGIALDECGYSNVTDNNANNNELIGIWVRGGLNNIIDNNANNNMIGVVLDGAGNCTVARNNLSNNVYGIELEPAYNCSIYANNITSNSGYGISLGGSQSNLIYHNNFINNTEDVEVGLSYYNTWDDGYPSGGNYWSDYGGADSYSGPYQNETGSDGIGDTSYFIDANNTDNYPLVSPYEYWSNPLSGDINKDMKVNYKDLFILSSAYGSTPEDLKWNPHADLNGDDEVNYKDLFMIAANYGEEWEQP